MSALIRLAAEHWQFVSPLLRKPKNEADYDELVTALDELLDLIGEDESNPLMSLVDILSDWIEAYDHEHRPMPVASGADVLRAMMREHGLNQSDLPGVGTQSVVSEILSGKRKLNLRQIRWLAERFGVSVETFI
ncbi:helix-turn-helix domain-containing protein [Pseudomonas sp. PWP3-1b2]|uniref:helix-turn-helix domain-containing protein n=1 Tax=Pseudomonas sp. PWP3-1b2 TaxID=2804656 RepID=UPI003CE834D1